MANHNRAFNLAPPDAKYCKVVSADDWILPECVARMVEFAEAHPSVGLVGTYQLCGGGDEWYVRNDGLPYGHGATPGREVCRLQLLGMVDVFGTPTSSLYRADIVRKTKNFFPNETTEADRTACFECMRVSDFGLIHQVLSYERLHWDRMGTTAWRLNAHLPSDIHDVLTYGPMCLTQDELENRVRTLMEKYYNYLALSTLNSRDEKFWAYHRGRLEELGYPMSRVKLSRPCSGASAIWRSIRRAPSKSGRGAAACPGRREPRPQRKAVRTGDRSAHLTWKRRSRAWVHLPIG
jgi:hypothetical protein